VGNTPAGRIFRSDPATAFEISTGFSHIAVQVDDLAVTLADLAGKGVAADASELPGGEAGPKTSNVRDPDGYRIELVEWPLGHPNDMTRADFL
jgi:lactoylglutathione lyase